MNNKHCILEGGQGRRSCYHQSKPSLLDVCTGHMSSVTPGITLYTYIFARLKEKKEVGDAPELSQFCATWNSIHSARPPLRPPTPRKIFLQATNCNTPTHEALADWSRHGRDGCGGGSGGGGGRSYMSYTVTTAALKDIRLLLYLTTSSRMVGSRLVLMIVANGPRNTL